MKNTLERLKNVGTIVSLCSVLIMLCTVTGVINIDSDKAVQVVYLVCSVGTLLGIFNNPETSGIDLPGIDYPIYGPPKIDK